VKLYAAWGLDFIKADDMFGFGPNGDHSSEIDSLGIAIRKNGRPMVLSLPQAPAMLQKQSSSASTRKCGVSPAISGIAGLTSKISSPASTPGALMWSQATGRMPTCCHSATSAFGRNAAILACPCFTHDEQHTLMTMWSIGRSPLMFGGHLPDNDEFTISNGAMAKRTQLCCVPKQTVPGV